MNRTKKLLIGLVTFAARPAFADTKVFTSEVAMERRQVIGFAERFVGRYGLGIAFILVRSGQSVPEGLHLCTINPVGFIETLDGARIRFDG